MRRSIVQCFALVTLLTVAFPGSAQDRREGPKDTEPRQMLYTYLQAEAKKHFDARRQVIAALKSPEDIRQRQEFLGHKFVEALGGFPKKTPLNTKVTGTLKGDG